MAEYASATSASAPGRASIRASPQGVSNLAPFGLFSTSRGVRKYNKDKPAETPPLHLSKASAPGRRVRCTAQTLGLQGSDSSGSDTPKKISLP